MFERKGEEKDKNRIGREWSATQKLATARQKSEAYSMEALTSIHFHQSYMA